ncbi:hypothetical protein [Nonomuraea salmonea]
MESAEEPVATTGGTPGSRRAYFPECGGRAEVPVHTRETLGGAGALCGPAIVEDPESAIVVPPGWTAALTGTRAVHLTRRSEP